MNLPKLAVRRPITTSMVLISVLVIGGIALFRLPLAYLPEVDVPFIGIQIPYPNSSPTQVEKEITKPVEEVLATLSNVKKMTTVSRPDGAEVRLEFDWGQNLDVVRMQVSEKMDQVKASLPPDIGQVAIYSFNTNDIPVIQGRISAEGVDLSTNYDLLESRIVNRIRRVPGVARVDLDGVAPKEIHIDLVLDKVKEHGVDVGALVTRLRGAAANVVLGRVSDGRLRYTARAVGRFRSVDELQNLVVDANGLRLGEIAEINYEEPPIAYGRHLDLQDAVALNVYKESTANTVDVVRAVTDVIKNEISKDPLLKGLNLFVWEDQGEEITNSLTGLTRAGLMGALFAVFVLYFFLRRFDSTLIVSLSIPFSVIAACAALFFLGKSLNILSMMGLMLGVGMLVDNAVVVLESIDREHRVERDPQVAALVGARRVTLAVTASTLTTLIVFLPLIIGANTDLTTWLREVGIAISIALACSLFSSLTLIPLMSAHLLREKKTKPSRVITWLEDRYVDSLAWTLKHRWKTAGLIVVFLGVGLVPFFTGMVKAAMFSATVNKRLFLHYEFADFVYKSKAERAVDQVEAFLDGNRQRFDVDSIYSYYGENEAATTINLTREDLDDEQFKALRQRLRDALPKIPGVKLTFEDDRNEGGSSTYFAVNFFGQDSAVLQRFADEAQRRLETLPGIEDVHGTRNDAQREIRVSVDRDKANRLGLTAKDIADLFDFTLGGLRLHRFDAGEREVETWLSLRLEDRAELADVQRLPVGRSEGRPVTLGDIATFEIVPRPHEIDRENRKVQVAVRATYEGKDWSETKKKIEGLMNAFDLPPGYSWGWNDRILEQENQGQQMLVNFLLALVLVYLVMASLFESLAQPFAILISIPFAIPGAAWLLAATRTPLNLMSQIGLLILMGIVVNNGIVLLDHMNQLRKEGRSKEQAILEAGRDRLRPILMTATTTIVGLLPLAIGGSRVSGLFYFPLARTVMGGLLSSSVLTLVVLPLVTLGVEGIAAWGKRLWWLSGRGRVAGPAAPASEEPLPSA